MPNLHPVGYKHTVLQEAVVVDVDPNDPHEAYLLRYSDGSRHWVAADALPPVPEPAPAAPTLTEADMEVLGLHRRQTALHYAVEYAMARSHTTSYSGNMIVTLATMFADFLEG